MRKKRIAIFASGSGTNAERIMSHFRDHEIGEVSVVLSNRPDAHVLVRAAGFEVNTRVFDRDTFHNTSEIPDLLFSLGIDLIVLAGFLWLIPSGFIRAFPEQIINIHPALLPKYGGKGMYGSHVHEAVIANGEAESGISIHYVNEIYDNGRIIQQERCEVKPGDSPESLARRIHQLEYQHYPHVIERLLREMD
ncbi:MAG: phosphoribosylglycinamide formyltransferase [Bacteroidales bacterium]|nr:phosphoribosylglycinamide formyltransferase [Bacteroidales bacterium]